MDPLHEALVSTGHDGRTRPLPGREIAVELVAAVLLLATCALLAVAFPGGRFAPPLELAALVVAYAAAARVSISVGAGETCPVELVLVPMLFAAPPAFVPLLVAAGFGLGRLIEIATPGHVGNAQRTLLAVLPDAWHAVGPALVFGIAAEHAPALGQWPIYVAALGAQLLFDAGAGVLRERWILGVAPALQLRVMGWVSAVDWALAPIGLLLAMVMVAQPVAIVFVLPLTGLLAVFARERDQRIRQALQLSSAYRGTALLMGDVLEADDAYTGGEHTQGVVGLALEVGAELGLDPTRLRDLEFGSLLHDIGKLRISNEIINKPGKLSPAEWEIVRSHPIHGQEMLARVGGALEAVGEIVRAHHERVDGGGYPDGLRGDEIPLAARIICACDSYSAMTTTRSYRPAMSRADAVVELRRCAGLQFDADVVEALIAVTDRADAILTVPVRVIPLAA
jgi:HD-GYP domain-containing protein (c-di-GMP phosphodiesterase class II)